MLLVGAGRIGELAAANLSSRGAAIAYVANRPAGAAQELAGGSAPRPIALDEIPRSSARSTSCSPRRARPTSSSVRATSRRGAASPLFFIDIAVPRDVDPGVHELAGCYLYDIDDLEAVVAETLAGRRAEAERAEQLVAEEAERFRAWQASLDVVPAIASLRARAEEIRDAELAKLGRLPDHERRTVESVTTQILNKLLHLPTVRMKQAAAAAEGARTPTRVRHLFGLEGRPARGEPDVVVRIGSRGSTASR